MLNLLLTQWLATDAFGDHDPYCGGQCCGPQPGETAVAGGLPALSRQHSGGLGHCIESPSRRRNHALSPVSRADAAPVSEQGCFGESALQNNTSLIDGQADWLFSEAGAGPEFGRAALAETGTLTETRAGVAARVSIEITVVALLGTLLSAVPVTSSALELPLFSYVLCLHL